MAPGYAKQASDDLPCSQAILGRGVDDGLERRHEQALEQRHFERFVTPLVAVKFPTSAPPNGGHHH